MNALTLLGEIAIIACGGAILLFAAAIMLAVLSVASDSDDRLDEAEHSEAHR